MTWWAILWPFLKNFEGFKSKPYQDQRGIWTIGYGTTRYPTGIAVGPHDAEITETMAVALAFNSANIVWSRIRLGITRNPTQHQIAAFVSLSYNIGTRGFLGSSLLAAFNAHQDNVIEEDFTKWDKIHIHGSLTVVNGLLERREAEYQIYKTND